MTIELEDGPPSRLCVPELETVRRYLDNCLAGSTVAAVEVATPRILPGHSRSEVVDLFLGQQVRRVDRNGRHLILHIGDAALLLLVRGTATVHAAAHTGVNSADTTAPTGSVRLSLITTGGRLWLCDNHAWGRANVIRHASELENGHMESPDTCGGVDPLSAVFTLVNFKRILKRKKRTIYQILVDDELIAGIGNQYADEILFAARLRPTRPVSSLKQDEVRRLYYCILEVLQKAIRFGGIVEGDNWLIAGQSGTFQRFLCVFGREGQACPTCRARIRATSLGKVKSCFCPRCQQ